MMEHTMKQRNSKTTERTVYVEFQSGIYVHVIAESDAEAVDHVNRLVRERRLIFDADSVRDDLLDNVVTVRCGETEIVGDMTKVSEEKRKARTKSRPPRSAGRDPFRFSIVNETFANEHWVVEENAREFAESVVNYPTETSWVRTKKTEDGLGVRYFVYGQFHNNDGHTEHVDDCLERFTMRNWREIADHVTKRMLEKAGRNAHDIADIEWPTPEIAVTKTADVNDNDCIDLVKFEWETSEDVFRILSEDGADCEAEEICPHCDAVIRFRPVKGKDIIVCPDCGKAICACSLCDCQNHGSCDDCDTERICARVYGAKEVRS